MKKNRHATIIKMVESEVISTQEDLMKRLRAEGFDVTQATVSRDIKNLGLIKTTDSEGVYRYSIVKGADSQMDSKYLSVFSTSIISAQCAGNIVALKCYAGMASAAAVALDGMNRKDVVATIAGDDTIFVLCEDNENAKSFRDYCMKIINK